MAKIKQGAFKSDLMRSFKQLKESRAIAVTEDVEIIYKRKIEDLCKNLRQYSRDREDMILDLSPASVGSSSVVPSDFKADALLEKDIELGLKEREDRIKLEIVLDRYQRMFGPVENTAAIMKVLPDWEPLEFEESAEEN